MHEQPEHKMEDHQPMNHEDMDMSRDMTGGHGMNMPTLPRLQQAAWIIGTFVLLGIAVYITNLFAPITF